MFLDVLGVFGALVNLRVPRSLDDDVRHTVADPRNTESVACYHVLHHLNVRMVVVLQVFSQKVANFEVFRRHLTRHQLLNGVADNLVRLGRVGVAHGGVEHVAHGGPHQLAVVSPHKRQPLGVQRRHMARVIFVLHAGVVFFPNEQIRTVHLFKLEGKNVAERRGALFGHASPERKRFRHGVHVRELQHNAVRVAVNDSGRVLRLHETFGLLNQLAAVEGGGDRDGHTREHAVIERAGKAVHRVAGHFKRELFAVRQLIIQRALGVFFHVLF